MLNADDVSIELWEEDGIRVIAVDGELDLAARGAFWATISRVVEGTAGGAVLVDLGACRFMDSSGLGPLVAGLRLALAREVAFAIVCDPASEPAAAMRLSFDGVVGSFGDRAAGLAALAAHR